MDPLLLDIPHRIETPRLVLRAFQPGDGAIIFPSARESIPQLKQWMPWATDAYDERSAEQFCRKAAGEFALRVQLQYQILSRDEEHFGAVGAFAFNWDVPTGEIGYWLRTSRCGNGYMTEAVSALTAMLFERLGFHRVEIRMDDRNERSWRVAERCGFRLDGIFPCDSIAVDGALRDSRIYSKTRRKD